MPKLEKAKVVEEIKGKLSQSAIVVVTDYRGLSAKEMTELRNRLREAGAEYKVVKNTLARFATIASGQGQMGPLLEGPVAIAFGYEDVVKLPKALSEYIRSSGSTLQIRGGMLGDRLLSAEDILTLSKLPPRDILISQIIGQMRAPLQTLHNILSAPLWKLLTILQAKINQLGGENVAGAS